MENVFLVVTIALLMSMLKTNIYMYQIVLFIRQGKFLSLTTIQTGNINKSTACSTNARLSGGIILLKNLS